MKLDRYHGPPPQHDIGLGEMTGRAMTTILEAMPDFVCFLDAQQRVLHINRAGLALVGPACPAGALAPVARIMPRWSHALLCEQALPAALAHGRWAGESALLRADGVEIPVSMVVLCHRDGAAEPVCWSILCRDISERRCFEAVLLDQVRHDALTGLPNRVQFDERLHAATARAAAAGQLLGVIFLDIDHFKKVNDAFGHAFGDDVLKESARRLSDALRDGDMLARRGDDEFILFVHGLQRPEDVVARAQDILGRMRAPFYCGSIEVDLSASLGIGLFPLDGDSAEGLLHSADMAMNSAKKSGRDCYRFHTADMDVRIRERLELEHQLRYALERGELSVMYQPRVDARNGEIVGMEALARWHHATLGQVPPARFIPIAEECGLIERIGMWVLRHSCAQAAAWQAAGLAPVPVSVNLSAHQLRQAELAAHVRAILEQTGLAPAFLELEITESAVMEDTASAIRTLRALKEIGVTLSIDDFGTGHSSLSYLKVFPIDVLKIDRSFVKDVNDDPDSAAIARTIIALAQTLSLQVVAEGVETAEQAAFLLACGCDTMQGFYFAQPAGAQELAGMLRARYLGRAPGAAAGGA